MNKYKVNSFKKYRININKPASILESIKRSEFFRSPKPIKRPEIYLNRDTIDHYEPEKITGVFSDKYIECKSSGSKNTSIKQYLGKIRPYLGNMIDNLRASGEWKIHLRIKVSFM